MNAAGSAAPIEAVVVGCSAGGLRALQQLFSGLSPVMQVPIMVVCHTGSDDVGLLCELLARRSPLPVMEARERMAPMPGGIHVAPSGYHLLIERARCFALNVDPKECFVRPAINVLFETAAEAYGAGLAALLLTGANDDGAAGLKAVRRRGGVALVQDPLEAEAPEMPRAALALAGADHILPLSELATKLNWLCKCP